MKCCMKCVSYNQFIEMCNESALPISKKLAEKIHCDLFDKKQNNKIEKLNVICNDTVNFTTENIYTFSKKINELIDKVNSMGE